MPVLNQRVAEDLLAALDTSHIGIAICDRNLRFRAINRALARMNGLPPENHLGKTIHEVLGSAARVIEPVMNRAMTRRTSILHVQLEAQLPGKDRVGHWVADYFPVTDTKGDIEGVCALILDSTREMVLDRSLQNLRSTVLHKLVGAILKANTLIEQCNRSLRQSRMLQAQDHRRVKALERAIEELQIVLAESVVSISATGALFSKPTEFEGDRKALSQREREVVRFLSKGKSNKEVAMILGISVKTIETHISRSMTKLHLDSLSDLIHYAIRNGIVEA